MVTVLLGAIGFLAAVPSARADDRDSCRWRVERAEARLRDAVEDHGYYSHQAFDRRRDLNRERERCYDRYHAYWSGERHEWRSDRDWDRDDRFRGRDERNFHGRDGDHDRDDRFRDRDHDGDRY